MQWSGASRARYSVWCTGCGSIVPHLMGGDRVLQRRTGGAHGRSHWPKHGMGSLGDSTGVWCSVAHRAHSTFSLQKNAWRRQGAIVC